MAVPTKDSLLAAWTINAKTRIAADYADFGLSLLQSTTYSGFSDAFIAAWTAINTPGAKSKSLVSTKNQTKADLLKCAREIYAFVQANQNVSNANKDLLDVKIRKTTNTPLPAPGFAPEVSIVEVIGTTVRVKLQDSQLAHRAKPGGVFGATVISHIGPTAPTNVADYKLEGVTGKTFFDINFPTDTPAGSRVWIAANWFNYAKETGPTSFPISTTLQAGGVGTGTED